MGAYRTPIIDKLKTDSASFYTFGSAVEDIGLNINERNNKVALTHYVLLNIPYIAHENGGTGVFSINNFIKDSTKREKLISAGENYIFPKIMQNYALNFETVLRNKGTYDYSAAQTVSEKIFWKMLQKSGALRLQKYTDNNDNVYYHEDFSDPDSMVIKGFGQIATSSQTSNTYNMNNETYILIPSSYGQMKYYMSDAFDVNYTKNTSYAPSSTTNLEGFTKNEDTDFPILDDDSFYKTDDSFTGVQMEFDIEDIKTHLAYENNVSALDNISYDNLAYDSSLCLASKYSFNTILVYYTIYDTNGNTIATNLFGVMVLDSLKKVSSSTEENISVPFSIDFSNGYPKTVLPDDNTASPNSKIKISGKATTSIEIPKKESSTSSSKNVYFTKGQYAKEISALFSVKHSETTSIQFISETTAIIENKISLDSVSTENYSITEITGDDGSHIFYKVKYNDGNYHANIGIRFLNDSNKYEEEIYLAELTQNYIDTESQDYYIPSYLKTKTTEGSFGSEYSFRLNIQTASIYDKNDTIIDYSSGNMTVLDDFNGVLSNLRIAIEVLKSNSVVQAQLYNDFQTTKLTALNASSKVDTLEKDVNNLLHGNVREISADSVNTNTLSVGKIKGDVEFVDASGNTIGNISNDTLSFNNITTDNFAPSSLSLSEIKMDNEGFDITLNGNSVFSINSNGEMTTSSLASEINWYYGELNNKEMRFDIRKINRKDIYIISNGDYDSSKYKSVDDYLFQNWYKTANYIFDNDGINFSPIQKNYPEINKVNNMYILLHTTTNTGRYFWYLIQASQQCSFYLVNTTQWIHDSIDLLWYNGSDNKEETRHYSRNIEQSNISSDSVSDMSYT